MAGRYRGVILILIAYALMTGESVVIHHVGSEATPLQYLLMRNLGCAVLVGWLMRGEGMGLFRTRLPALQVCRALLTSVSLWCMFYGFATLPLADATALTYTRAIFLIMLAGLLLGERITPRRWLAVAAGIGGALVVIRPGFAAWQPEYLIALAGAGLNAGSMVATKALDRQDSTNTIMAWLTALSLPVSLPALSLAWPTGGTAWLCLAGIAALGASGLYVGLLAIRAAELSVLAPFDFSRLIMAAGFGLLLFGEVPDLFSLIGVAIIIAACTLASASAPRSPMPRSAAGAGVGAGPVG